MQEIEIDGTREAGCVGCQLAEEYGPCQKCVLAQLAKMEQEERARYDQAKARYELVGRVSTERNTLGNACLEMLLLQEDLKSLEVVEHEYLNDPFPSFEDWRWQ
jgi:hypothetical protein